MTAQETTIQVPLNGENLEGNLHAPPGTLGVVLFAHGSGSSRHSPRNRYVAQQLHDRQIGTLLIDLLTSEEERQDIITREHRFDIDLLTDRLTGAADWLAQNEHTAGMPLGLFGASTGAAAAIRTAARTGRATAVVSRGGRPDLAGDALRQINAPTLLIVGQNDEPVIEMNQDAMSRMTCKKELRIVPGATHLFEEPGTLEQAAHHARDWFEQHFRATYS